MVVTSDVLVNFTSNDPFDGIVLLTVRTATNATAQDQTILVIEGAVPPPKCERKVPIFGSIPVIGVVFNVLFGWLFCLFKK
jgi:hypothetical protein